MELEFLEFNDRCNDNNITKDNIDVAVKDDRTMTVTDDVNVYGIKLESIEQNCENDTSMDSPAECTEEASGNDIFKMDSNDTMLRKDKNRFIVSYMNEEEMNNAREIDRNRSRFKRSRFKCEKCIFGFGNEDQLLRHIRDKHYKVSAY